MKKIKTFFKKMSKSELTAFACLTFYVLGQILTTL